jgi:hypothetical protein
LGIAGLFDRGGRIGVSLAVVICGGSDTGAE